MKVLGYAFGLVLLVGAVVAGQTTKAVYMAAADGRALLTATADYTTITLEEGFTDVSTVCVAGQCAPAAAVRSFIAGYMADAGSEVLRLSTINSLQEETIEQQAAQLAELRAQLAGPRITTQRQQLEQGWRETLKCAPTAAFSWPALVAKLQGRDGGAICASRVTPEDR